MELKLITAQGGDFEAYYSHGGNQPEWWLLEVERLRQLLRYFQEEVEGPPQWFTLSHACWFYLSDFDDWRPAKANVFLESGKAGFVVRWRAREEWHCDAFDVVEVQTWEEVGQAVVRGIYEARKVHAYQARLNAEASR